MEQKKYLPLYYKWLKNGYPGGYGLCRAFKWLGRDKDADKVWDIFHPEDETDFWFGGPDGKFTPMRQNIVLLMAAMNDEL